MKINAFSLDSVNSSIKKLCEYRNNFETVSKNSVKELMRKGYEYMISIVWEDRGNLKNSITWEFDEVKQKGVIHAETSYAVFVEYGTGIIGANSQHPNAEGWKYDVNSHGIKGWWYFDEHKNKFSWTRGQGANAFIYKTYKFLEKKLPKELW